MVAAAQALHHADPGFGIGFELGQLIGIDHIFDVAGNQGAAPGDGWGRASSRAEKAVAQSQIEFNRLGKAA
ncbi:hypothetical protein [Pseudomonas piscis]|uniref:hypothetical protein n=1 Tax=Pseudomonas piscis TaxID=2614538 RepID=UPI0003B6D864|nr:hypothetical protein [Pseudomonas piscis]ERO65976.1 hypothetical protein P308_16495 [Pseudomonas piscis]